MNKQQALSEKMKAKVTDIRREMESPKKESTKTVAVHESTYLLAKEISNKRIQNGDKNHKLVDIFSEGMLMLSKI